MPHCVLEYSSNILEKEKTKEALKAIHVALDKTGLFQLADIKSRAVEHHNFLIGDGDSSRAFVTLSLSILSGRSDEVKKMLSSVCLEALKQVYTDSFKNLQFSLTVQIKEMDKNSYMREINY